MLARLPARPGLATVLTDSARDPSAPSPPPDRWLLAWWLLAAFCTALVVWPLWVGRFLPLYDAAQVAHQASVIWDWNLEPVFRRDFVRAPFPTPNFLGVGLLTLLAPLGGVLVAHKIVLSLCVVGLVAASGWLVRAAGHSRWLIVAAVPWAWHQEMFIGHLAHSVGLPIFLAILAAHLGLVRQPGPWRALLVALLFGVLAVTHVLLWALATVMLPLLGAILGWQQGRWRGAASSALRDLGLGLPGWALMVAWFMRDVVATGSAGEFSAEWRLPMHGVRTVFRQMFDVFAPRGSALDSVADLLFNRPGDVISALWLLGVALWLLASIREPAPARDRVGSRYLVWAAGLVALAYLLFPAHVFRPVWVHGLGTRLVAPMLLLSALALPLDPMRPGRATRMRTWAGSLALLVAAVWLPISTVRSAVLVQPEFDHMAEAMASIPRGKAVLVLRPQYESHWMQMHLFADIGQYAAVLRGAAVPHVFIDPVLQPVRTAPGRIRPAPPGDDHERFSWHDHGRYYDYVALFRPPFGAEPRYEALLRSWPRVFQRGRWQVFQNLHPEPWPPPPPTTPPPRDPDAQVAESVAATLGTLLGFDWALPFAIDPELVARDEALRAALGLPSRNPGGDLPLPPAATESGLERPVAPLAQPATSDAADVPSPLFAPRALALPLQPAIVAPMPPSPPEPIR